MIKKCKVCGNIVRSNDKYCSQCGNELIEVDEESLQDVVDHISRRVENTVSSIDANEIKSEVAEFARMIGEKLGDKIDEIDIDDMKAKGQHVYENVAKTLADAYNKVADEFTKDPDDENAAENTKEATDAPFEEESKQENRNETDNEN